MTSSEDPENGHPSVEGSDGAAEFPEFKPKTLEAIREEHGLGEEWQPRFTADTPIAEQKAEEYREVGYEAEVFPHPDDVGRGQVPGRGDRCVVYTRPREADREGGIVDDDLL